MLPGACGPRVPGFTVHQWTLQGHGWCTACTQCVAACMPPLPVPPPRAHPVKCSTSSKQTQTHAEGAARRAPSSRQPHTAVVGPAHPLFSVVAVMTHELVLRPIQQYAVVRSSAAVQPVWPGPTPPGPPARAPRHSLTASASAAQAQRPRAQPASRHASVAVEKAAHLSPPKPQ